MNYTPHRERIEAEALSFEQLKQLTGLGRTALYKAMADGRLPARKFGRKTIILRADARAFLAALPAFQSEASGARAA